MPPKSPTSRRDAEAAENFRPRSLFSVMVAENASRDERASPPEFLGNARWSPLRSPVSQSRLRPPSTVSLT
jgi:hypothetical protein